MGNKNAISNKHVIPMTSLNVPERKTLNEHRNTDGLLFSMNGY